MPREKIVIGIATYGRGWTLKSSQRDGIGSLGTASKATKFIGESGVAAYYEVAVSFYPFSLIFLRITAID